jgi:hypothetical protein
MSTKITPTVGRVVWFYPHANAQFDGFSPPVPGQPLAAIIAAVLMSGDLNLAVFDAVGVAHSRTVVPLVQEGDEAPADGYFATWMPYQIGQAKKHADEPKAAAMAQCSGQIIGAGARDDAFVRSHALDMALRTPGLMGQQDVIDAVSAYKEFIQRGGLGIASA